VVFCHDDITIETKQWGSKLLKQFEKNPTFGIIGVAGSKYLPSNGRWWENLRKCMVELNILMKVKLGYQPI
jgi:hypothetical protein